MTELIMPRHAMLDDFSTIKREQHIPDSFLQECHDNRVASNHGSMGEMHQFASIPTAVVDHWMRQGFDVYKEDVKSILKRLRDEDLSAFITTDRQF